MNFAYFSLIDQFNCDITQIKQQNRRKYIQSINDKNRQNQSICVWLLLEKVLKSLNLPFDDDNIIYKNNRWQYKNNKYFFSLSHKNNVVAVAISSEKDIAIDIEEISNKCVRVSEKLNLIDINTKNSISQFEYQRTCAKAWTKYECRVKCNLDDGIFTHKIIENSNKQYIITVLANNNTTITDITKE